MEKDTAKSIDLSAEQIIEKAFNFHSQGNISEATKYYQLFISKDLKDFRVFSNYGVILKNLGKLQEAEIFTRKATELNPNFAKAHYNLGILLKELGNLQEAEISFRKSIELDPSFVEAHSNFGIVLYELGDLKEAEVSFRKAIKLNPDFFQAYSNLGNILQKIGNSKESEISYRKAITLNPQFADAHLNLGNMQRDLGKYYDAIKLYQEAIKLNSELSSAKSALMIIKRDICDWTDESRQYDWLNLIGIKGTAISPWEMFALEDNPINHLKRATNFYRKNFKRKAEIINSFNNRKVRIGYFSADFRAHPTMFLISSILKIHDKSKFEIYLYSFAPKEDKYTEVAKNCGCIFRDIKRLNDIEVVELARKDNLDIAIDLMGYTKNHRMSVFSYRVAPIQINYLGFPGSVGSNCIDYIIADKITIPQENSKFYSEKIIRMPNCFQCNDDKKEICQETISKEYFNLPEKGFIFVCFNSNYKISKKEFDIWMRLLKEIEGSVLWLYQSNEYSINNLRNEAISRRIDADRLIFAKKLPLKKHLARYSLGDLALDTFNYNGGATTSDALWGGLPVLTKLGESFSARISASILTSIGLPELITYSEQEYENKALYLARNNKKLSKLKSKLIRLRERTSLFNSKKFTRDLESKLIELLN